MEFLGNFVMVMSCSNCNVSCKHCYVSYKGNFSPEELKKITLDLGKKYNVMINGAEPLVNLEYLNAYPGIHQEHILTNGLVLVKQYDKVTDELKKHGIKKISISYHFDIHNEISKVSKKKLETIFRRLNLDGFNTRIMSTITSSNYQFIEQYCRTAHEMGADGIKFTNFVKQGNARQLDDRLILTEKQKKLFFEQLAKARSIYNKEDLLIERCGTFGRDNTKIDKNFRCGAGTELAVITPDRMVYPCVFLAKEGNEIGRYENGKIEILKEFKNNGDKCIACEKCNIIGER